MPDGFEDEDEPELWPQNSEAWLAFNELALSRPVGMGPGAIPFSEIAAWMAARRPGRTFDPVLLRKIQAVDGEYLEHARKESETRQSGAGAKPPPGLKVTRRPG